ncbi:MAG: DNA repair protein RecN, partial [Syntrophaceae bacterium]|nr:DNA repair protein RecN [Syntrophaceae bacterium]
AGKSIIIGAVGLLLGDRASMDMIRSQEDEAVVEALFRIDTRDGLRELLREKGIDCGEELVVRRVVSRIGKNRVYLNGSLAPLASLAEIGELLINICGQHEHQVILKPENHLEILDEFGGLLGLRANYQKIYRRYLAARERLASLRERQQKREEREELLRFQADEITAAELKAGEDAALGEEKKILVNCQRLAALAEGAHDILYGKSGAVLSELRNATGAVKEILKIDPALKLTEAEMDELYYRIEEAAFTLRDYAQRLSYDPARLEEIEERLEMLGRLKRKYGSSLEAVLQKQTEVVAELRAIASLTEEIDQAASVLEAERAGLSEAAVALSESRKLAAQKLKERLEAETRALKMDNARFAVLFHEPPAGEASFTDKGADLPELYLSANVGEELKPLKAIASGGELSRIMLSIKKVLAQTGSVGTMVFDEVDSGIGGATAEIVGRKLKEVARRHQVVCITHLPQIACYGDRHYLVAKQTARERTLTSVTILSPEERIEEISRMLGGVEVTQKTREHAREMLRTADGEHRNDRAAGPASRSERC